MTYIPECENAAAREEMRKHNELVDTQWDLSSLLPFSMANPIAGQSAERVAKAVQGYARSLGYISECCLICGDTDVRVHLYYAGKFCAKHSEEGHKRDDELDRMTCGHCSGVFKHGELEHGLCGSCSYEFNN